MTASKPARKPGTAHYSPADSKFVDQVRSNVKTDLVEITADKLENILLKHVKSLGAKWAWVTPLSLFLTALGVVLTATFTDKFGMPAAVWQALFLLLTAGAGVWLLVALVRLCFVWRTCTTDFLISVMKNAQEDDQNDTHLDGT
jgi:hypothetical protein